MPAAPSSLDPSPWRADSLTYVQRPITEHVWSLTARELVFGDGGTFSLDAFDITVDIDASRIPIATATFKIPAEQAAAHASAFDPAQATFLTLNAGWKRAGVPDLQPIFAGGLTAMETSGGVTSCRAESMDGILGARGAYTVPAAYTRVAQVVTDFSNSMVINAITLTTEGTLPTPTAGQLAAFRGITVPSNGNQMEALAQMATTLGCWIRGSLRTPTWLTVSARYDTGTPIDLTSMADPAATTIVAAEGYAPGVVLTAKWVDGKTAKQSQAYYRGQSAPVGFEQAVGAAVEINYKPAGGELADTDPIGMAYANAYANRRWRATTTTRAIWWLQPRQLATFAGKTGQIDALTYDVDGGHMTLTIRPTSAY